MEERIISYEEEAQVPEIIQELQVEDFLLVEHKSKTKQLFFKKTIVEPESIIMSDP